jgi:hypothetical protein
MYVLEAALLIRYPISPSSIIHCSEREVIQRVIQTRDLIPHTCWLVFESRVFTLQHLTSIPFPTPDPHKSSDVPIPLQMKYLPGTTVCLKVS